MKRICFLIFTMMSLEGCSKIIPPKKIELSIKEDKSSEDPVNDDLIKNQIRSSLFHATLFDSKIKARRFNKVKFEVNRGEVFLSGDVRYSEDMLECLKIIWNIDNIKRVENNLNVTNDDIAEYVKDSWTTIQIKLRIMKDLNVKNSTHTIVTVRDVLYILGSAKDRNEIDYLINLVFKDPKIRHMVVEMKLNKKTEKLRVSK